MRDTPWELVWTAGIPLLFIIALYFLQTPHGLAGFGITIWGLAIYCVVSRWLLPILWFDNVALADATYFILSIGGLLITIEVILKYFFGLSILKLLH